MERRALPFDLMIITDPSHPAGILKSIEFALQGATKHRVAIQLRNKTCADLDLHRVATKLRKLTTDSGAYLLINGRPDIALCCDADGVHLPEAAMPVEDARTLLGEDVWIGVSKHDAKGLTEASVAGANYATLSPIHAVPQKKPPIGFERFRQIVRSAPIPTFALGGLKQGDLAEAISSGAAGVAVCRAVLQANDPGEKVKQWLRVLDSTSQLTD